MVSVGLLSILITFFYFSIQPHVLLFSLKHPIIKAKPLTVRQQVESTFH